MTGKDFDDNDEVRPDAEGAEAAASAPEAQAGDQAPDEAGQAEQSGPIRCRCVGCGRAG